VIRDSSEQVDQLAAFVDNRTDPWVLLPLVRVVPALTLPTNGVGPRGHPRQG